MTVSEVPLEKEISLRAAAKAVRVSVVVRDSQDVNVLEITSRNDANVSKIMLNVGRGYLPRP